MTPVFYDVIIVGAGPAGLSAALILARCRRAVLVIDSNKPRNAAAHALHGYLTRDGVSPFELRRLGRKELEAYPTVQFWEDAVVEAQRGEDGFEILTKTGTRVQARLMLLATGRVDALPEKPGFQEFYGKGVYHCPYCDGWENRDRPIAVYGNGKVGFDYALELLTWSAEVTICTDGSPEWDAEMAATLERKGIRVIEKPVARLEGANGFLQRVRFADAETLDCTALFFCSDCSQKSSLPEQLGCSFDDDGAVKCDGHTATRVPGMYVAGNVRGGLHLAIAAAAEGAESAVNMNDALLEADLEIGQTLEKTVK